jgi:hypothetical protein
MPVCLVVGYRDPPWRSGLARALDNADTVIIVNPSI